jgi:hypothetical protein
VWLELATGGIKPISADGMLPASIFYIAPPESFMQLESALGWIFRGAGVLPAIRKLPSVGVESQERPASRVLTAT